MALFTLLEAKIGYGGPPLLDGISLIIEPGERIGLLGRNGAGKSTLMKVIAGEMDLDDGECQRQPGLRVARLTQEVPAGEERTIYDVVAVGLGDVGERLAAYHHLSLEYAQTPTDRIAKKIDRLQHDLDITGGWDSGQLVDRILTRMNLPPDAMFGSLSSGMKRRVLLAQALVLEPDILLLDEPTNHLDIESITWLEEFLARYPKTLIFVTHDRVFLQKLATRIIEIERGRLFDWTCDYQMFLKRKEEFLEAEARQEDLFDKKLAEEERWIRQGIKARRTRNEGRVRALKKLREERRQRKSQVGNVRMLAQAAERSGQLILQAENVNFAYQGRPIVQDLSLTLIRGDRVGLIGPNGCGKTTLLRLILGDLKPDSGTMREGTNLQVAYFDQLRAQLDEDKTAQENVGEGANQIQINGQNRHVLGYLQDFLFTPERARSLVRYLSGGERNRLLFAKQLTKPSNELVLDEPTNDLDTETLELLEELLAEYPGTLLLVSHDRAFLNNVVTSTLAYEGDGVFREYDGGYDDWLRQRATITEEENPTAPALDKGRKKTGLSKKLSFKEQRELEELPLRIEQLETELADLEARMSDPEFYRGDGQEIAQVKTRFETLQAEMAKVFTRWETLEARAE
jgi:ATP-binding cassette subfamily F protein uup